MDILPIKSFTDNYIWMLVSPETKQATVVDPGDAEPILEYLANLELKLANIMITHHHWDHTGGIDELCAQFPNIKVYGPNPQKITSITHEVKDGDSISINSHKFKIIATPGHTLDHIVYFSDDVLEYPTLFCGDTLFSCGCGRLFEGTAANMLGSLKKIMCLPKNTLIYPAHEYTLQNIDFSISIEPENIWLKQHLNHATKLRGENSPTLPVVLENELKINPFLRYNKKSVYKLAAKQGIDTTDEVAVFSFIRKLKDNF